MTKIENRGLEYFGEFISKNLRDTAIEHFDMLSEGRWKAPSILELQKAIVGLSDDQRLIVRRLLLNTVDSAIHDFLFKLQEQSDLENRIKLIVDGIEIIKASDGIHGEIYLDNGWFAKYSKEGEPPDEY